MKLDLVFGSVVFLIAGITLASNSSEVMGQSDLDKAKDILKGATNATEGGLQKYENATYGISFMYPPEWGDVSDDCPQYKDKLCGPGFAIMSNDTKTPDEGPVNFEKFSARLTYMLFVCSFLN